jgi:hypothetical protein
MCEPYSFLTERRGRLLADSRRFTERQGATQGSEDMSDVPLECSRDTCLATQPGQSAGAGRSRRRQLRVSGSPTRASRPFYFRLSAWSKPCAVIVTLSGLLRRPPLDQRVPPRPTRLALRIPTPGTQHSSRPLQHHRSATAFRPSGKLSPVCRCLVRRAARTSQAPVRLHSTGAPYSHTLCTRVPTEGVERTTCESTGVPVADKTTRSGFRRRRPPLAAEPLPCAHLTKRDHESDERNSKAGSTQVQHHVSD